MAGSRVTYRLSRLWDGAWADWKYKLTKLTTYDDGSNDEIAWSGDKQWAQNHANHYSIEMPKEEE